MHPMLPRFRQLLRGLEDVSFLDPERLNELLSDDDAEPTLDETIDVVVRAKANGHWAITGMGSPKLEPGPDAFTMGVQEGYRRWREFMVDAVRLEVARAVQGKITDPAAIKGITDRVHERLKAPDELKEAKGKKRPPKKAD